MTTQPHPARQNPPADLRATMVDGLLARVPAEDRDRPIRLLSTEAAAMAEQLTGYRPHRSWFHRVATKGSAGQKLAVLLIGRGRFTTARAIATFCALAGEAMADRKPAKAKRSRIRRAEVVR